MLDYIHGSKKRLAAAVGAALLAGAFSIVPRAEANPVLDAKDAAVSISGTTNMNITSGAVNNLIKWVDFSIGKNESVTFDANNYLNYVTGSARSEILGALTGGGKIYLVNPNGILIGDGATVNVGSLYLSTKNLTADQLANYSAATGALFKNDNAAVGDVINLGNLNANVISVEGNNITFKNVADVNSGSAANVTLTAISGGEIHIGSVTGGDLPAYDMSGTDKKYMYKLVSTPQDLQDMRNNLNGNYMLAKNIDMNGVTNFSPIGDGAIDFNHYSGESFSGTPFTGNFDGLNYEIQNLHINNTTSRSVGLFGANSGTIRNVGLVGGSVVGGVNDHLTTPKYYIGSVAGINFEGTVENVYNTGTVTGNGFENYVGGVVGRNQSGAVKNVYNIGTVTGTGTNNYVGGIVGKNSGGAIESVFNNGAVTGDGTNNWLGGIAGSNVSVRINGEQFADGTITNAYNTGAITSNAVNNWIGGIVGEHFNDHGPEPEPHSDEGSTITNVYNVGGVTGTGTNVSSHGIVGNGDSSTVRNAYTSENGDLTNAATFTGFGFVNGVSSNGAWRIYERKTMPLLTAFLTRKDNIKSVTESDGTTAVGATYTATTYNGVQAQNGYNYIKDVSIVTPAPTPTPEPTPEPMPMPTPEPTPEPTTELPTALETIVGSREAAKEYTDVVASLDSGANTVLPTTNVLPTESIMPTNSVLPTGNNRPTGNTQPTGSNQPTGSTQSTEPAAQENNSASDEQSEAQEQNGLLPAQQTTGGQSAAGSRESHLGITYSDINMPKSMSVEALAAALNGEPTATLPNNAGGEVQPTGTQGAPQEGDEEEA